jgi:hypothetical protein
MTVKSGAFYWHRADHSLRHLTLIDDQLGGALSVDPFSGTAKG